MKSLRILLVNFIILSIAFSASYGEDNSDCARYGAIPYGDDGFGIINKAYKSLSDAGHGAIINKTDLETAIFNLQKYCCENKLGGQSMKVEQCANNEKYFNPNALDSPYLFDHLFDVVMRRLSGLNSDTNIYTKTNMTIDDVGNYSGKKWRDFIKAKAEDLEGSDKSSIGSKYNEFWKDTGKYNIILNVHNSFKESDQTLLRYISGEGSDEAKKVDKAFEEYNNRTLLERYKYSCMITEYLYALINQQQSSDKTKILNILSKGICDKAVEQQIENEKKYVTIVGERAGKTLLTNYIKGYISYLDDRGNQLKALWKNASDRFLDVVRAVPGLVKKCVK